MDLPMLLNCGRGVCVVFFSFLNVREIFDLRAPGTGRGEATTPFEVCAQCLLTLSTQNPMSIVPPKSRFLALAQVQSRIFQTVFNPTQQRTGAKYLKQKLKGDAIKSYYGPTEFITTKQLNAQFPLYKFVDPEEEYRLDILASRKRRGKGAPQKKREAPSADGKKKKK